MKALKRPIFALIVADAFAGYSPSADDSLSILTGADGGGRNGLAHPVNAELIIGG